MGNRFKAWLIILAAAIVMTFACFAPAVKIDSTEVVPGWSASTFSIIGTGLGIAKGDAKLASACGLGLAANIIFVIVLMGVILQHLFGWKQSRHRALAVLVMLGTLASLSSIFWLRPATDYLGAWLWGLAQGTLAAGLWILPQRRQGGRGFEVVGIPHAGSALPLAVANNS